LFVCFACSTGGIFNLNMLSIKNRLLLMPLYRDMQTAITFVIELVLILMLRSDHFFPKIFIHHNRRWQVPCGNYTKLLQFCYYYVSGPLGSIIGTSTKNVDKCALPLKPVLGHVFIIFNAHTQLNRDCICHVILLIFFIYF
jgi:hypothetical protein